MKLANAEMNLQIEFLENQVIVLIMEEPGTFSAAIQDLLAGEESQFILYEGEKNYSLEKAMEIVVDPFSLDFNNRKILQKLYKEWALEANEMFQKKTEINTDIINVLSQLQLNSLYGEIKYNLEFSWEDIFKIYQVGFQTEGEGILEKLLSYMKILSGLLEIRILCIVNLKTYLSEEQLKEVYQMAFYCKLQLLLIENREQSNLEGEKTYIIDRDRCLIIK